MQCRFQFPELQSTVRAAGLVGDASPPSLSQKIRIFEKKRLILCMLTLWMMRNVKRRFDSVKSNIFPTPGASPQQRITYSVGSALNTHQFFMTARSSIHIQIMYFQTKDYQKGSTILFSLPPPIHDFCHARP